MINNLLINIEEIKREKLTFEPFSKEFFTVFSQTAKKEINVEVMLKAFLRNSDVVASFKPTILKYIGIVLTENL